MGNHRGINTANLSSYGDGKSVGNTKNVFFDTETTGWVPGQVGQLAFIVENQGKIELAKNYFFTVKEMTQGAQDAHHMSKEFLAEQSGGMVFKDVGQEIHQVFKEGRLVAHNLNFDERFLSAELWRLEIPFSALERQCTMEFFKNVVKIPNKNPKYKSFKNPKLAEVVDAFRIDPEMVMKYSVNLFGAGNISFHDARFDTTAMYVATNIYREMSNSRETEWQKVFCKK